MGNGGVSMEECVWSLRRESDQQRYVLWDALADFGSGDLDGAALQYCMCQIAVLIDAQQAFWGGIVRVGHDSVASNASYKGWRLGAWTAPASSPDWMHAAARTFNGSGVHNLTASCRVLGQPGRFRVFALSKGMVDLEAYQKSQTYDYYYRQQSIVDRIWIMFPVNDDSESCFCFDRCEDRSAFDEREIKMAAEALRGIKWFHRQLLLCHGLGVAKQNLTPASVHQYVRSIYRKFSVHGRPEFMSLWLNERS